MQNKGMNLKLSSVAKPRLKWTPELHQRFVDAVNQLGGSEKATPKSVMRVMGTHGITLYHLKSHLQKYRLVKSQHSQMFNDTKQEGERESQRNQLIGEAFQEKQNQTNENTHIAQALQVQMDVQRKLFEQIEVQRHLQIRIEAQGKYLQTVLHKAQETLSGYRGSDLEVNQTKEELSKLASMVNNGCSSSISALTDIEEGSSILKNSQNKSNGSLESCLTSSENEETDNSMELSLMEMQPKRNRNTIISKTKSLDLNRGCLNDNLDLDTNIVLCLN